MPSIELETLIDSPAEKAFKLAQEVEKYPSFASELKEVKVLKRDGDKVITQWVGIAELGPFVREVRWEEEDIWDEDKLECSFNLISGDMKKYSGIWKFESVESGQTLCKLSIDYELGIPLLGAMVEKMIHEKVLEVSKSILNAVKELAEQDKC